MLAITQQAESPNFREFVEESKACGMRSTTHIRM